MASSTLSQDLKAGSESTVDREWIAKEFSKGIEAERDMEHSARDRSAGPPEPALGVLYGQIAEADARHASTVETVAVRYGHTPSHGAGGGIAETLGRLKDKVSSIGTTPQEWLAHDLATKANAIHWYTAWARAFEAIGDSASAKDLSAVLAEESGQRDALQQVLNRMVERGARGGDKAVEGTGS